MTMEQRRAMRGAITNHLIVSEIFENLPTRELKVCRLVNHQWKKMASHTILKNDACTLTFEFETCESDLTLLNTRYVGKYFEDDDTETPESSYENHPLKSLNDILTTCPDFPCTHLTLYCNQDSSASDYSAWTDEKKLARKVTLFQLLCGERFKTLRFEAAADCSYTISLKLFIKLMTTIFINVEKLVAVQSFGFGTGDESNSTDDVVQAEPFLLPSLTFIKWSSCGYSEPIIRAAVNLKEMVYCEDDVDSKLLEILADCGKSDILQTYERIYYGDSDWDDDDVDDDGWSETRFFRAKK